MDEEQVSCAVILHFHQALSLTIKRPFDAETGESVTEKVGFGLGDLCEKHRGSYFLYVVGVLNASRSEVKVDLAKNYVCFFADLCIVCFKDITQFLPVAATSNELEIQTVKSMWKDILQWSQLICYQRELLELDQHPLTSLEHLIEREFVRLRIYVFIAEL